MISIISASLSQISRICQFLHNKSNKFSHKIEISAQLTINSNHLNSCHVFAHNKISQCKDKKIWNSRSDVYYIIQAIFIQDYIITLKEIEITFNIEIYTMSNEDKIIQYMKYNIQQMSIKKTANYQKLITALTSNLK